MSNPFIVTIIGSNKDAYADCAPLGKALAKTICAETGQRLDDCYVLTPEGSVYNPGGHLATDFLIQIQVSSGQATVRHSRDRIRKNILDEAVEYFKEKEQEATLSIQFIFIDS